MKLQQDKATSQISTSTTAFLEKITLDKSIECIPFQHITEKSREVSFVDFCAFGLMKKALSKLVASYQV